ncbi:MAG: hypothetical protein WAV38_34085 [Xanthobacteraceae bacterium]
MTNEDKIAALEAEVDKLKASQPTPVDAAAVGAWRDRMRGFDEARASAMPPSVVRDWAVIPDDVVKAVGCRDARAPAGPSSQGVIPSSQQVSNVRSGGGGRGGWSREVPLSPPAGINYVDALLEVDSARKRGEAMIQEAKRKVAESK